jgi:hypothetical protein
VQLCHLPSELEILRKTPNKVTSNVSALGAGRCAHDFTLGSWRLAIVYMVKLTRPPPGQTCCGVVEDTKHSARQRRNSRKPQPWPLLKFTIAIALCIIGFTSYVYVARFCLPMILKRRNAFGGRVMGSERSFHVS